MSPSNGPQHGTWLPETLTLSRPGRSASYCVLGDPAGAPVLVWHGSPGSRYQMLPLHTAAAEAGLRLIALDRPGVGQSSPEAAPGFSAGAGDALAVLDALGISSATALGFSGGAGYALAFTDAHRERIDRVVLVCGMIPGAPHSTLRERIPIVSALYRVARVATWLATAMLDGRGPFARTRAANFDAWPEADRAVMTNEMVQQQLAADAAEATRQGSRAAVNDLRWYSRPFDLGMVSQPVQLLHGTDDGNVPIAVARWAATQLPNAALHELPNQGHYFAAAHPGLVIDALRSDA